MFRNLLIVAASGMLVSAAAPAFAQDQVSVRVPYTDLNLAEPAGAAALKVRIADAVRVVCGPDVLSIAEMTLVNACREEANDGAERQAKALISLAKSRQSFALAKADASH